MRSRLLGINFFMRVLNEGIARKVNKADKHTDRYLDRFLLLQSRHTLHPS